MKASPVAPGPARACSVAPRPQRRRSRSRGRSGAASSRDEHAIDELDVEVLDVLLGGIVIVLVQVAALQADHERCFYLGARLDRRAPDGLFGVTEQLGVLQHLLL